MRLEEIQTLREENVRLRRALEQTRLTLSASGELIGTEESDGFSIHIHASKAPDLATYLRERTVEQGADK